MNESLEKIGIERDTNLKVEPFQFGRFVNADSKNIDGETVHTTLFQRRDEKFDSYVQQNLIYKEKMQLLISKEDGLPRNFFSIGSEGTACKGFQLAKKISDSFEHFYQGHISEKEIESTITEVIIDLRSSYIEKGYDESEFMSKIIENTYDIARLANIRGAGTASWYEGRELESQYNGSNEHSKDWIYYNADYYYRSEEMKDKLLKIITKVAGKYEINSSLLNLPTEYQNGDLRKGIYSSYNTLINERLRNDYRIGNMIDETMVPPKGLRFFYKGNSSGTSPLVSTFPVPFDEPEAFFDSVLSVWYKDWSFHGRVPVRQDPYRFPSFTNMFDVVSREITSKIPSDIIDFFRNFDFFTENQSESYINSHPRKY